MARINIESTLFTDKRFIKLCELLKEPERAIGALVLAWLVAQEHYKNETPIPIEEWQKHELKNEIIEVGLARVGGGQGGGQNDDAVYMCGSGKHLKWIATRTQAASAGGKKSAMLRLKSKQKQPNPSKSNQIQPSSSSSSSSSKSKKEEEERTIARESPKEATSPAPCRPRYKPGESPTAKAGKAWREEHDAKYRASTPWGARQNGQLSNLLRSTSEADLLANVKFYFSWNEPFVVKSCHSLDLFVKIYSRIHTTRQNPGVLVEQRRSETRYNENLSRLEFAYGHVSAEGERSGQEQADGAFFPLPDK